MNEKSNIQSYGTDSLCFNKNDFMKKDFDVDTFVQLHQASGLGGLEALRDDLGVYLKILRSSMIDLINRDYADFVNLSTNLTGLDQLIDTLKTPLGQLREEVLSVEQLLSEAITSVSNDLIRRHSINQQKALLHRINQISVRLDRLEALLNSRNNRSTSLTNGEQYPSNTSGSGNDLVDRLATEVNHLNFLVAQCEGASMLNLFKPRVEAICNFVEVGLERGLREGIQGSDKQLILRTLRTYACLGTIHHAHQQVRTILKSHLEDVISDVALKSDPRGLHGMFEKALTTVKKVCDPLITVTSGSGNDVIAGYSFLESSAWPEIVSALETKTQHIFNPGNPALFHERYKQSIEFTKSFEKLLGSKSRIDAFRESPDFHRFLEQWNLPVYYQLRYQEIGQVMESSLVDLNSRLSVAVRNNGFKLTSTETVWESLLKCFSPDVFLLPLLHRFWKLTLLILSRHRTFVVHTTNDVKEKTNKSEKNPSVSARISQPTNLTKEVKERDEKSVNDLQLTVYLLRDIETLSNRIQTLYSHSIQEHVDHFPEEKKNVLKDTLQNQSSKHLDLKDGLIELITENLISSMIIPLKQVTDTPRIYRRTNKPLPTVHQSYVMNAFAPPTNFYEMAKEELNPEELKIALEKVFSKVANQYLNLTYEVLSSVHKMEESLRRLKRARDRGSQTLSNLSNSISDDDKIRSQIHLDIMFFGTQISSFGIDASKIESYSNLQEIVMNAKDGKFNP